MSFSPRSPFDYSQIIEEDEESSEVRETKSCTCQGDCLHCTLESAIDTKEIETEEAHDDECKGCGWCERYVPSVDRHGDVCDGCDWCTPRQNQEDEANRVSSLETLAYYASYDGGNPSFECIQCERTHIGRPGTDKLCFGCYVALVKPGVDATDEYRRLFP